MLRYPTPFSNRTALWSNPDPVWNRLFSADEGGANGAANNGLNPSAVSRGSVSPFNQPVPDLGQADPEKLAALTKAASGYTYSIPGGGYIPEKDSHNANSYYVKYGGSDPTANRNVQNYYDYISSLPTKSSGGTEALQQFNQLYGGSQPQAAPGPSLQTLYGGSWQPLPVSTSKFTSTPRYGGGIGW